MEDAVRLSDRLLIESRAPELGHRFRSSAAGGHVDAQILESDVGHDATLPSPARTESGEYRSPMPWTCPSCQRQFARSRQGHDCAPAMTLEEYFSTGPSF